MGRAGQIRAGRTWALLAALIVTLAGGVLLLDSHQARRGAPSLLGMPWGPPARTPPAPAGTPPRPAPRAATSVTGRVALVIDGLGERADVFQEVIGLGRPVTVAVLPGLPLSARLAREAARAGLEVLVQLPLEPYHFPEADPGPGTLLVRMPPEEVAQRTRRAVASIPEATGVITRMGSRFTEDPGRMGALLEVLRERGLFFVDSLTSQASVGYDLARAVGLRAARRRIFLDPDGAEGTTRTRLAEVERWGTGGRRAAVVVGHGRLLTVRLIAEALPRWEARGLRLVRVSELLDPPAPGTTVSPLATPMATVATPMARPRSCARVELPEASRTLKRVKTWLPAVACHAHGRHGILGPPAHPASELAVDEIDRVTRAGYSGVMHQRWAIPAQVKDDALTKAGRRCGVPTGGNILAADLHHIDEDEEVRAGGPDQARNLIALGPGTARAACAE